MSGCVVSASPGCSNGRFNTPGERRKAGETARTLHQFLPFEPRPRFSCRRPPSVKAIKGQTAKRPKAGQDRLLTKGFSAFARPIHKNTLVSKLQSWPLGLVRHRDRDFSPRAMTGSALLSPRHFVGPPHPSCAQPSLLPSADSRGPVAARCGVPGAKGLHVRLRHSPRAPEPDGSPTIARDSACGRSL